MIEPIDLSLKIKFIDDFYIKHCTIVPTKILDHSRPKIIDFIDIYEKNLLDNTVDAT